MINDITHNPLKRADNDSRFSVVNVLNLLEH
jgi:hypothetical protein